MIKSADIGDSQIFNFEKVADIGDSQIFNFEKLTDIGFLKFCKKNRVYETNYKFLQIFYNFFKKSDLKKNLTRSGFLHFSQKPAPSRHFFCYKKQENLCLPILKMAFF